MKKRINIPQDDHAALIHLITLAREKHATAGEQSPLQVLNWDEINAAVEEAKVVEAQALEMRRLKLAMYEKRRNSTAKLTTTARRMRDILAGVFRNENRQLEPWGFKVHDAKAKSTGDDVAV